MTLDELKKQYNELIDKINKQEQWIVKNSNHEKIEIFIKKFNETLQEANLIIKNIETELKIDMTKEEILNGF
jgi:F0F1-type ATP synthase membrane subunit b/b'